METIQRRFAPLNAELLRQRFARRRSRHRTIRWNGKNLGFREQAHDAQNLPLSSALGASCKEKEVICIARLIALGFSI